MLMNERRRRQNPCRRVAALPLIILAASLLLACPKQKSLQPEDNTKPPVAPLALDNEDFGLGIRVGDNMRAPIRAPYTLKRSNAVSELTVEPGSPVVSFLVDDCLAVSFAYELKFQVTTGIVITAWPGKDALKLKKTRVTAYLERQLAAARKAHEDFPKVATRRGIGIGSTADEVRAAYGTPVETTVSGSLIYEQGNLQLIFGCGSGKVLMMVLWPR